jgi:selenocysteine lyase/cysteine desulfurase
MLTRQGLDTREITARVAALRAMLEEAIASGEAGRLRDAELLHPNREPPDARFVALRHPNAVLWKSRLMAANIITDARDDVLRIGLGLYHDESDVPAFCAAAAKALG